jgi:hypothetical protein
MRTGYISSLSLYLGALVSAVEVVYVTDLSIFTSLVSSLPVTSDNRGAYLTTALLQAPCAQSALSYNVMRMTYDACPETELQSCICTKNQNLASVATGVSKSVSYSCGPIATEDQASAATVSFRLVLQSWVELI